MPFIHSLLSNSHLLDLMLHDICQTLPLPSVDSAGLEIQSKRTMVKNIIKKGIGALY